MADEEEEKYVVIHVDRHGRQFWTGNAWAKELDSAKIYSGYVSAMRTIWKELPAPDSGKLTAAPKIVLEQDEHKFEAYSAPHLQGYCRHCARPAEAH